MVLVFNVLSKTLSFVSEPAHYFHFSPQKQSYKENKITLIISSINTSNAELNPIRHLLALVGARHFVQVSRIRVKYEYFL